MAYTKTIWKDHLTEHPYRYKNLKTNEVLDLEPQEGEIFQEGTPINAEKLNNIEGGIEEAHRAVTSPDGAVIGLRIFDGNLQYKKKENWVNLGAEIGEARELSSTKEGKVSWTPPVDSDSTLSGFLLVISEKDISNYTLDMCNTDAEVTKNFVGIDKPPTFQFTDLKDSTQYWIKLFSKFSALGQTHWSQGITTTFFTPYTPDVLNFENNGEILTWSLPPNGKYDSILICYSKTVITEYTIEQCQNDDSVIKIELDGAATRYQIRLFDKVEYYIKIFLENENRFSKGIAKVWRNNKQWLYREGDENIAYTGGWILGDLSDFPPSSIVKEKHCFVLNAQNKEKNYGRATLVTKNIMRSFDIKVLYVELEFSGNSRATGVAGLTMEPNGTGGTRVLFLNSTVNRKIFSIDISTAYLKEYFSLSVSAYESNIGSLKVYNIWGES